MQKKLLSSLFLFLLFNLLVKPFWILGIDVGVYNAVGAQEYGFYFAIFNFSLLFNILLDLGVTNFNSRNIAQNTKLITKHLSGIVVLKLGLGLLFTIITFGVGLIIGYDSRQFYFLGLMCINQFLCSFILYLRSNLGGLLLFKTDSFLSILDRILMILFCGILLWGNVTSQPFKIEWFVYCQTAAYMITLIVAFILVAQKAKFKRFSWNIPFYIAIIKQSFPFAILVLLMSFYNRIDSVMLERLLPGTEGDYQSGIYAGAYRLLDSVNMIAYLFSVPLLPIFAKMLKAKENIQDIAKLAFTLIFIISVSCAVTFHFHASQLMAALYKENIPESAQIFRFLILGFIPISTTYIFGTLLTADKQLKYLNLIALGGMTLNIVLDLILIPNLKAVGTAYSSLITQTTTALMQVLFVVYLFKFAVNRKYLLKLVLFICGIIVANIILSHVHTYWISAFCIIFLSAIILTFGLGLISVKNIIAFVKSIHF